MTDTHALRWGVNGTKIRNKCCRCGVGRGGKSGQMRRARAYLYYRQVPAAMLNTGHGWATTCRGHCVNLELTI